MVSVEWLSLQLMLDVHDDAISSCRTKINFCDLSIQQDEFQRLRLPAGCFVCMYGHHIVAEYRTTG